jgi:nucleotide-binding universal stress UspA family protein
MYSTVVVARSGCSTDRDAIALIRTLAPGCARIEIVAPTSEENPHQVAERVQADLIVVPAPAPPNRRSTEFRSVLHRAPCAIAVAPTGYADRAGAVARIGVAHDGSAQSAVALRHAIALAAEHAALVVARQVLQLPPGQVAIPVDRDPGELGIDEASFVIGSPRPELLAFGDSVDVLFCGSRQYGAVRRIALGSTSDYLAHRCTRPLFVTPTHAGDIDELSGLSVRQTPSLHPV